MVHLAAGLILVGLGVWGMVTWWSLFGLVMRGVIPFMLLFLGMIAIMASVRRLSRGSVGAASRHRRGDEMGFDDARALNAASADATPLSAPIDEDLFAEHELMRRGLVPKGS